MPEDPAVNNAGNLCIPSGSPLEEMGQHGHYMFISNWDGGEFSRLWGHLDPYSFGDQGVEVVGIEKHGLITRFGFV